MPHLPARARELPASGDRAVGILDPQYADENGIAAPRAHPPAAMSPIHIKDGTSEMIRMPMARSDSPGTRAPTLRMLLLDAGEEVAMSSRSIAARLGEPKNSSLDPLS